MVNYGTVMSAVASEVAQLIAATLARLLAEHAPAPACPPRLGAALRYCLLAPGKRLRPQLVLLAHTAAGGAGNEPAVVAGCALEMVHTYSLIHDDLPAMDDDDLRRGRPTCHKAFDEATAILAGDALLTLAFEVVANEYPPRTASACIRELAHGAGAVGMVGGQAADLAAEGKVPGVPVPTTLEELEAIHARKTGALFRAALRMGVFVAQAERAEGVDADTLARLDTFGRAYGLAFQITDDVLDVESSAERTGKRTQKDAARGKLTYPGLLGVAESRRRAQAACALAAEAIAPLGTPAEPLGRLVWALVDRDH
jgi:geranylgeranyl diphosphate synthase type II